MNDLEIAQIILDASEHLVYLSDIETHDILYLSNSFKKVYGLEDKKDWEHKKCYELLQNRNTPCPFCTNDKLEVGNFYTWQWNNPVISKKFYVQDTLVQYQGRLVRLEIAHDITDRIVTNKFMQMKLTEQQIINTAIEMFYSHLEQDVIINRLLEMIGTFYTADRSYVFIVDEEKEIPVLNNTHEWCAQGVSSQIDCLQNIPQSLVSSWFKSFERNGQLNINSAEHDLDKNSEEYKLLKSLNIQSLILVPLLNANRQAFGFIGVDHPKNNCDSSKVLDRLAHFYATFRDTQSSMELLYRLSHTDGLTSLKNRYSFQKKISELKQRESTRIAVAFIDINGLKKVNDQKGHEEGDALIMCCARLLLQIFQEKAYRIGGDEFVVLCSKIGKTEFESKITLFNELAQNEKELSIALGSHWVENATDIMKEISYADNLMYEAKRQYYSDKNCVQDRRR